MNPTSTDFEQLLREALAQAKAAAPHASDDLVRFASRATEAVARVTDGVATLDLVPITPSDDPRPTYQLQFRKVGSQSPASDLGIYRLSAAGYPIQRWYSITKWREQPEQPDAALETPQAVEGHFKWLVSKPESRLVILVAYFQQQAAVAAAGG
jgi:hypothetical protein